jgi:hypothetical protein
MTLQNHKVDDGTPISAETFIDELHQWITEKMHKKYTGLASLKTMKGRDSKRDTISVTSKELHTIVEDNEELIADIARALELATSIKNEMIAKMEEANEWINKVETRSAGMKTAGGEGFVISDVEGNIVKLVDRSSFSFANRSTDVIKGFEHPESLTESKLKEEEDEQTQEIVIETPIDQDELEFLVAQTLSESLKETGNNVFVKTEEIEKKLDSLKRKNFEGKGKIKWFGIQKINQKSVIHYSFADDKPGRKDGVEWNKVPRKTTSTSETIEQENISLDQAAQELSKVKKIKTALKPKDNYIQVIKPKGDTTKLTIDIYKGHPVRSTSGTGNYRAIFDNGVEIEQAPTQTETKFSSTQVTSIQESLCGKLLELQEDGYSEQEKGNFLVKIADLKKELILMFSTEESYAKFLFEDSAKKNNKSYIPKTDLVLTENVFDIDNKNWFRSLLNMTVKTVLDTVKNFRYDTTEPINLKNYMLLHQNIKDGLEESNSIFSNSIDGGRKDSYNPSDIFFASTKLWKPDFSLDYFGIKIEDLKFKKEITKKKQKEIIDLMSNSHDFFDMFEYLPKSIRIQLYTKLLRKGLLIGISLKQVFQREGKVSQIVSQNPKVSTNSTFLDPEHALKVRYDTSDSYENWTFSKIILQAADSTEPGSKIKLQGQTLNGLNSLTRDLHFTPKSGREETMGALINLDKKLILEAGPDGTDDNARYGKGTDNLEYFNITFPILYQNYKKRNYKEIKNELLTECGKVLTIQDNDAFTFKMYIYLLHYLMNYNIIEKTSKERNLMYNVSKLFSFCAKYPLVRIDGENIVSENDDKIAEYLKIS